MEKSLLPPNTSELERAVEQSMNIYMLPVVVANNPLTALCSFLPFLAQSFSVDVWDEQFSEQEKRDAIINSIEIHKYKGTVFAVKKALSTIFGQSDILEFTGDRVFEFDAVLQLKTDINSIYGKEKYELARKLVNSAKNARSRFINFQIEIPEAQANINEHTGATLGLNISTQLDLYSNSANHLISTAVCWKLSINNGETQ